MQKPFLNMCDILRVLLSSTNALCKHSQRNDSPFSLCTIDLHGIYEYMAVKYAETLTAYIIYAMGSCLYLTAAAVSDGVKIMQERKKNPNLVPWVPTSVLTHIHTHYILSPFECHINPCVHGIYTDCTPYTMYEYHIKHFHSLLYLGSFFSFASSIQPSRLCSLPFQMSKYLAKHARTDIFPFQQ